MSSSTSARKKNERSGNAWASHFVSIAQHTTLVWHGPWAHHAPLADEPLDTPVGVIPAGTNNSMSRFIDDSTSETREKGVIVEEDVVRAVLRIARWNVEKLPLLQCQVLALAPVPATWLARRWLDARSKLGPGPWGDLSVLHPVARFRARVSHTETGSPGP